MIFSFFFLVYLLSNGGHLDYYDGTSAFLMTENFVLHGNPLAISIDSPSLKYLGFPIEQHIIIQATMRASAEYDRHEETYLNENVTKSEFIQQYLKNIDKKDFLNGNYVVLPVLAAPLYMIAQLSGVSPFHFVPLFLNSIILSIDCVLVFLIGRFLYVSSRIGFVLSLIFGVTSFIWPYVGTMLADPIATMFLLLAIYLVVIQRNRSGLAIAFLAGISSGLSFLSYSLYAIFIPGVLFFGFLEFRKNKKQLIVFIIGMLVIGILQAYLDYSRFGSIFDNGIGDPTGGVLSKISIVGIFGYLFSPGRSICLYFPITVLYPASLYFLYKQDKNIAILFLYASLIGFLFIAISQQWWDQTEWGSHRYHLAIIPFITLAIGSIISKFGNNLKIILSMIILSTLGFCVNLFAVLIGYEHAFSYAYVQERFEQYPYAGFTWNSYYSPIVQTLKVLMSNWLSALPPNPKIGLDGCSFDLYLYCNFGLLPLILIFVVISIISFLIIRIASSGNSEISRENNKDGNV